MSDETEPYALEATERCFTIDLDLDRAVLAEPLEAHAGHHALLDAFYERRAQSPIGQEAIQGLQAKITAYSLHQGRWRGLTWHDTPSALVWLLAARYHRSGEREDAYPFFRGLTREQLLPTESDYERAFSRQGDAFARALLEDVPRLVAAAHDAPGTVIHARLIDRIDIRLVVADDERVQLAVGQRLHPGDEDVPPDWEMALLAAVFADVPTDRMQLFGTVFNGAPVNPGEVSFTHDA